MASPGLRSTRLFHPNHPYHWLTIGWPDDLKAATLEDVRAFFRTYYHPSNASLALAGDIDPERAFELAERYFGDLAPGPVPAPVEAHAEVTEPQARSAGRSGGAAAAAIGVALAGRVRGRRCGPDLAWRGDRGAARRRGCIARWCSNSALPPTCRASQQSRELGGMFQIVATAAPGVALGELERGDPRRGAGSRGARARRRRSGAGGRSPPTRSSSTGCRPLAASAGSPDQLNSLQRLPRRPLATAPKILRVSTRPRPGSTARGRRGG